MSYTANPIQQALALLNQGKLEEATATLLQANKIEPDNAEIMLGLGIAYARQTDFENSLIWLQKALGISPSNPNIHLHLADVLRKFQRNKEAIEHYQQGIALNPGSFVAHNTLAKLYIEENSYDDAIHHLNIASQLQPDNIDCHIKLAQLYELLNRRDEARRCVEAATLLNPQHIGVLLISGKIYLGEKNYSEAETLFKQALLNTTDETLLAKTYTDLAMALDKQKRFDDAYLAISTGKKIWSQLMEKAPIDRNELQNFMTSNKQWFIKDNIKHWQKPEDNSEERDAPIFFVGFPRSGTTLTEQILNQHPDIITSNELPLIKNVVDALPTLLGNDKPFPQNLIEASDEDMSILREAYWKTAEENLPQLLPDNQLVDKNPLDLMVIGFIARVFPGARILVAIRDPRDVCLSCFMQAFQPNIAMINFFSLESTVAFYTQTMDLWLHYRSTLDLNCHQYRYEDLVDDFDTTTRGIFEFLQLDYPKDAAGFHVTAKEQSIHTPSYNDVTQPIYRCAKQRWKNYEKYFAPYQGELTPFVKAFSYSEE